MLTNQQTFKAHYMLGKYLEEIQYHPIQMMKTVYLFIVLPKQYQFETKREYRCGICLYLQEMKNEMDKRSKKSEVKTNEKDLEEKEVGNEFDNILFPALKSRQDYQEELKHEDRKEFKAQKH